MKLGFSTWAMPKVPIDTSLKFLSETGYDGVTIAVLPQFTTSLDSLKFEERKRILNLSKKYSIPIISVMSFTNLMDENKEALNQNINFVKESINLANNWEVENVITGIGGKPGELNDSKKLNEFINRISELGLIAKSKGVTIALEPHVDQAVEKPDQIVDIIKKINMDSIRSNFDISHFNVQGVDVKESIEKVLPYSVACDVKDEKGVVPNWSFVAPGEGDFDYVNYLKCMKEKNYKGFITIEISFQVQGNPKYNPLHTAKNSYEILDAAFKEANISRNNS
tara:strand:- start:3020 stop:3862 length:843 start_codon:yes stop_codon:yes gene_type:complete